MIVFNLPVVPVVAASAGAFAIAGDNPWRWVAAFAVMAVVGGGLELTRWVPRLFWILPAWLVGLALGGLALSELHPTPGYIVMGAAGAAVVGMTAFAIAKKPGGKWLAGVVGGIAVMLPFQIIGYTHPEWKHPVLYVVNAIGFLVTIACGIMLYRARATAGRQPELQRRARAS